MQRYQWVSEWHIITRHHPLGVALMMCLVAWTLWLRGIPPARFRSNIKGLPGLGCPKILAATPHPPPNRPPLHMAI